MPSNETLAMVASDVEAACKTLISMDPQGLEACELTLQHAVEGMHQIRRQDQDLPAESQTLEISSMRNLQVNIALAGRLLQNGLDYYAKWLRIVSSMSAGYTAEGEPAAISQASRIRLAG